MTRTPLFALPGLVLVLLLGILAFQLMRIAQTLEFSPRLLRQSFVVGAGAEASLPARVVAARKLVDSAGASAITLSPFLMSDSLFHQRLSEYAYPVRVLPHASWQLVSRHELAAPGCREVDRSEDLVLYRCSHADG